MDESRSTYTTFRQLLAACLFIAMPLGIGSTTAAGQDRGKDITGHARVVDGDTLDILGVRVRLEGIDAPERGQRCKRRWLPLTWRCGRTATRALKTLINNQPVRCLSRGTDKYGRMIGVCFAAKQDLNAAMVRSGHAWAFTKYSTSYVAEEKIARAHKRGIWRAKTETAWAFRAKKWQASEQVAPRDCPIKGNISARGRVYHMPWSPWYARVRINKRKGERWFCSEAEARSAGWRPIAAI